MIGIGPYANQSGVGDFVTNSNNPGVPPERAFLNRTFQAIAMVQDGMIYGTVASKLIIPLPGTSVRTTNQAIKPPIINAKTVAPKEIVKE